MLENLKIRPGYDGFIFLAETCRNPPVLRKHHHVELELNMVIKGSITYVVSGRTYHFPQGSLLWFFPNQVHQIVDRTPDASYYVAVFKPALIHHACRGTSYRELRRKSVQTGGVLRRVLTPPSFQFLQKIMDSLMEDAIDSDLLNREAGFGLGSGFQFQHGDVDMLNAGLHYLLIQAWRAHRAETPSPATQKIHPKINQALQYLSEGPAEENLDQLAQRCQMSPSHLSRLFKEQIGIPLSRYRNSVRLNQLIQLHRNHPRKSLLDLAMDAGFGSYPQFHKIFSEFYKMSPRNYFKNR